MLGHVRGTFSLYLEVPTQATHTDIQQPSPITFLINPTNNKAAVHKIKMLG